MITRQKKREPHPCDSLMFFGSGARIWTWDLRVMSTAQILDFVDLIGFLAFHWGFSTSMITIGYKGRSTPQLSSWARFGHTNSVTVFEITRRSHSDSLPFWSPQWSRTDFKITRRSSSDCAQNVPKIWRDHHSPPRFPTFSPVDMYNVIHYILE